MADNSLEIVIRLLAQTQGADEVEKALARVKGQATDITKASTAAEKDNVEATGKAIASKTELRHIVGHLSREFPLLSGAVRAFVNPLVAGIMVAIMEVGKLRAQIKGLDDVLSPSEWQGRTDAIAASKKAFEDAAIGAAGFKLELDHLETSTDKILSNVQGIVKGIQEQGSAEEQTRAAEKKLALTEIDAAEKQGILTPSDAAIQRSLVQRDYERKEARAKELDENKILNVHLQERVNLLNRIDELQKGLPAQQQKAAEAEGRQAEHSAEREIYTKNIAASSSKIAEYDKELESRSKFGMRSGIFDTLTDSDVKNSRASEVQARDRERALLDKLTRERVPTSIADNEAIAEARRAEAELKAGRSKLPGMDRDIDEKQSEYQLHLRTNRDVSKVRNTTENVSLANELLSGTELGAAKAAANATQLGRGITRESYSDLMDVAGKLAGHPVTFRQAIDIMRTHANTADQILQELGALRARVETQNGVISNMRNRGGTG